MKYVRENFEECLSLAALFTTQEHKYGSDSFLLIYRKYSGSEMHSG